MKRQPQSWGRQNLCGISKPRARARQNLCRNSKPQTWGRENACGNSKPKTLAREFGHGTAQPHVCEWPILVDLCRPQVCGRLFFLSFGTTTHVWEPLGRRKQEKAEQKHGWTPRCCSMRSRWRGPDDPAGWPSGWFRTSPVTAPRLTYGITQKGAREATFTLVVETESSTNAASSMTLLCL
jgi:hypothetical protein